MPYTLKTQQIAVKDPDTGVYSGVDILAEQTTEGLLTEITATGEAVKADVSAQMATERSDFNTYVSGKEAELDQYKSTTETNINTYVTNKNQEIATMIADADEDVSDLEDRKQDVADAVADMLSQGVDNTLTTANVPAESKAVGDLFETIVEGKSTQPNDKWNRLWIKPSANDVEIPTMDEFDDLKRAVESGAVMVNKTQAFTTAQKKQGLNNLGRGVETGKNLANEDNTGEGFVNSSGQLVSESTYESTYNGSQYIDLPVTGGSTYSLYLKNTGAVGNGNLNVYNGVIFYDSSNTPVPHPSGYTAFQVIKDSTFNGADYKGFVITMPSTAVKMRINYKAVVNGTTQVNYKNNIQLELGPFTGYEAYKETIVNFNGDKLADVFLRATVQPGYDAGKNKADESQIESGFVDRSGNILAGNSSYTGSKYIRIGYLSGNTEYALYLKNFSGGVIGSDANSYNGVRFVDASGNAVPHPSGHAALQVIGTHTVVDNQYTVFIFTTPATAVAMYINYITYLNNVKKLDYTNNIQLEKGDKFTGYEPFEKYVYKLGDNELADNYVRETLNSHIAETLSKRRIGDMTIALIGDSITQGNSYGTWVDVLAENKIGKERINVAYSGSRWSHTAGTAVDNHLLWKQVDIIYQGVQANTYDTPDILIAMAGTNDKIFPIGDPDTVFNTSNIFDQYQMSDGFNITEGIRLACEYALQKFPNIIIVLMSPTMSIGWDAKETWNNICNAIQRSAQLLSCRFIDVGRECGIYGYIESQQHKYLADGTHPNAAGIKVLGTYIAKKLLSMFDENGVE